MLDGALERAKEIMPGAETPHNKPENLSVEVRLDQMGAFQESIKKALKECQKEKSLANDKAIAINICKHLYGNITDLTCSPETTQATVTFLEESVVPFIRETFIKNGRIQQRAIDSFFAEHDQYLQGYSAESEHEDSLTHPDNTLERDLFNQEVAIMAKRLHFLALNNGRRQEFEEAHLEFSKAKNRTLGITIGSVCCAVWATLKTTENSGNLASTTITDWYNNDKGSAVLEHLALNDWAHLISTYGFGFTLGVIAMLSYSWSAKKYAHDKIVYAPSQDNPDGIVNTEDGKFVSFGDSKHKKKKVDLNLAPLFAMAAGLAFVNYNTDYNGKISSQVKEVWAESQASLIRKDALALINTQTAAIEKAAQNNFGEAMSSLGQASQNEGGRGGKGPAALGYDYLMTGGKYAGTGGVGTTVQYEINELTRDLAKMRNTDTSKVELGIPFESAEYSRQLQRIVENMSADMRYRLSADNIETPRDVMQAQAQSLKVVFAGIGEIKAINAQAQSTMEAYQQTAETIGAVANESYAGNVNVSLDFEMPEIETDDLKKVLTREMPEIETKTASEYDETLESLVGPEAASEFRWKARVEAFFADIFPFMGLFGLLLWSTKSRRQKYQKGKKLNQHLALSFKNAIDDPHVQACVQKFDMPDLSEEDLERIIVMNGQNPNSVKNRLKRYATFALSLLGHSVTNEEKAVTRVANKMTERNGPMELIKKFVSILMPVDVNDRETAQHCRDLIHAERIKEDRQYDAVMKQRQAAIRRELNVDDEIDDIDAKISKLETLLQKLNSGSLEIAQESEATIAKLSDLKDYLNKTSLKFRFETIEQYYLQRDQLLTQLDGSIKKATAQERKEHGTKLAAVKTVAKAA